VGFCPERLNSYTVGVEAAMGEMVQDGSSEDVPVCENELCKWLTLGFVVDFCRENRERVGVV